MKTGMALIKRQTYLSRQAFALFTEQVRCNIKKSELERRQVSHSQKILQKSKKMRILSHLNN